MQEKLERDLPPLEKHIAYFGGSTQQISYNSITQQNERLGSSWLSARANAAVVMAGSSIKISGCPFAMFKPEQAVGKLNHPYSTGIYNLDGSINEDKWNQIFQYTEQDSNEISIIRESKLYEFLEFRRRSETRPDPLHINRLASNAEWQGFFNTFATTASDGTRFVPLDRLRKFYENSSEVGEEFEKKFS